MIFFGEINAFLQVSWMGLLRTKWSYTWNTYVAGVSTCKKVLNFHRETMCLMVPLLRQTVSFREMYVFLNVSWLGLFGTKWTLMHLEHSEWQESFLWKTNAIVTGNQCARCSWDEKQCISLKRYMLYFNSEKYFYLQQESLSRAWKTSLAGGIPFKK
jgi:hypothetical protein